MAGPGPGLPRGLRQAVKLLLVAAVAAAVVYWVKFSPVPVAEHRVETEDA